MGIKVKFTGLNKLMKDLKGLDDIIDDAKDQLADETEDLIRDGISSQKSPEGGAWAARKSPPAWVSEAWPSRGSEGKLLQSMKGTVRSSVGSKGYTTSVNHPWSGGHQKGFKRGGDHPAHIPARKMVPQSGLPSKWRKALTARLDRILSKELGDG